MSGCSAERLEPGHLVLAGRRHDVHSGPVSCHCRDRGQGDQRHLLTGVQQGPRLPASEHAPGGLACRFPGARRYRAWKALSRGHRREAAAGVEQMRRSLPAPRGRRDSLRPDPASALAAVIAEAAAYFDSGPPAVRAARADRRAAALAAAAALTCPVRTAAELRRLAMEPDQLAGEQCLNAERPVHEHPPISGGRPASRPRCATGAHCDIRR